MKLRIALYARVSRADDSQDPKNQLKPLRDYCKSLNPKSVVEYVDRASGAKSDRVQFLRLLRDADSRKYDLLLIWSLDRLSREGIHNTLGYLRRLKRNNISVKSLTESWLDTRDEGIGQLLLAIMAWIAEQERKRIIERVKAGQERARLEGKKMGRPKGSKDKKTRSKSGYHLRYKGMTKEQRKLGPRKKAQVM